MRLLVTTLCLILFSCLNAQNDTLVRQTAARIVNDLTAAEMHGRGYVNEGDRLAAHYIVQELQRYGVSCYKEGYEQGFQFPVNTFPGEMSIIVDGKVLTPGVDYIVHPASGGVQNNFEVVPFALNAFLEEAPSLDMTQYNGKALLLKVPDTKDRDSLGLYNAIAELLMDSNPLIKIQKEKLTWSVATSAYKFPLIEVLESAWPDSAKYVDIHIENKHIADHYASNVIGYIKGKKKKKEHIVITAHYDHLGRMGQETVFPGANDNASGVAMLLSLAEYYAKNPPERTIVFMAFAGEEAGLIGSHFYIDNPLFDLNKIRFLLNLDILGTGDEGIMVVNASKEIEEFDQLVAINSRSGRLAAVKKRGPACNSDHCAFVERGVPAFFIYTLGGVAYYHDVYDQGTTLPLTAFPEIRSALIDLIAEME